MSRSLTNKQRERLAEITPLYHDRVWILTASRDYVKMRVWDEHGRSNEWLFMEREKHFKLLKRDNSGDIIFKSTDEFWEYASLRALEVVFAIRNGHTEATERRQESKAQKQREAEARQPSLPIEYHSKKFRGEPQNS